MDIVKVLAVLGCLFAGFVAVGGVPCREWLGGCCVKPWNVACNKICPGKVDDWDIAAAAYKECSTGEMYHCAKDVKTNMFVEACAKPVFCGPGREPQIENGSTVSIVCKNCSDDRYNSKNISSADYFYQCPYKKLTCGEGQIECDIKDGFERLTTNRKCRCDVRKRFRSINGHTCTSDEHLLCLDDGMCKPTEDVMLNSSCGPRCPDGYFRNDTSDECIFNKRSERNQTVPNRVPEQGNGSVIHPSEAPTTSSTKSDIISSSIKPQEDTGAVQNSPIGIIVGLIITGIVIVVIAIIVRCKLNNTGNCKKKHRKERNGVPQGSAWPLLGYKVTHKNFEDLKADFSKETLNRRLKEKDLSRIAMAIGKNWESLGPFLHSDINEIPIQHIQMNNPNNALGQITEMLKYWRRISDSHTFENLLKALFEAKQIVTINWNKIEEWVQEHTNVNAGSDGQSTRTSSTTFAASQSGDLSSPTNLVQPDDVIVHETPV